ncbi:polysaccharide deacetylase family protein [Candidatus Thioglobus sp.]|nr:polysaccharide deacetylase family protein [Candidatus Thioglobus sp.]
MEFSIPSLSKRYIYSGLFQGKLPVFLYHSIKTSKSIITKNLHEVSFENFKNDVRWLNKNFDIVPICDLIDLKDKRGKAAITFDDGYLSIFKYALPFLIENQIPSTVFLNGANVRGNILWRDKIRYIINNKKVDNFFDFIARKKINLSLSKENFYYSSKQSKVNSKMLSTLIDEFFEINGDFNNSLYVKDKIAALSDLIQSEYVFYGNHGFNHYLMSSLSYEEQLDEVIDNENYFKNKNINLLKLFSIPFGGDGTYDKNTLEILSKNNYKTILLSRNRFNIIDTSYNNNPFVERFMPQERDFKNIILISKMILKAVIKRFHL